MLWLLLPMLAIAAYGYAQSLSDFSRRQRIASLVTRGMMMLLLALGLAGLTMNESTCDQFIVVGVDQSLSVDGTLAEKTCEIIRQIDASKGRTKVVYLPFAAEPDHVTVSPPESLPGQKKIGRAHV